MMMMMIKKKLSKYLLIYVIKQLTYNIKKAVSSYHMGGSAELIF